MSSSADIVRDFRNLTQCAAGDEVASAQLIEERRADETLASLRARLVHWLQQSAYVSKNPSQIDLTPLVAQQNVAEDQYVHRALRALVWLVQIAVWSQACPSLDWESVRAAYLSDTFDIPTSAPHSVARLPDIVRLEHGQTVQCVMIDTVVEGWIRDLDHEIVVALPRFGAEAGRANGNDNDSPSITSYRSPWPLWPTVADQPVSVSSLAPTATYLHALARHETVHDRSTTLTRIARYLDLLREDGSGSAAKHATAARAQQLQQSFQRERTKIEADSRARQASSGSDSELAARFVQIVTASSLRANGILSMLQQQDWTYTPGDGWSLTAEVGKDGRVVDRLQYFTWASGGCGNSCYVDAWLVSAIEAMRRIDSVLPAPSDDDDGDPLLRVYRSWQRATSPALTIDDDGDVDVGLLKCFAGNAAATDVDEWQRQRETDAMSYWRWLIDVRKRLEADVLALYRSFLLHAAKVDFWRWAHAQASGDVADPNVFSPTSCRFGSVVDLHALVDRRDMQLLRTLPAWGMLSDRDAHGRYSSVPHFTSLVDLRRTYLYRSGWALRNVPQPHSIGASLLDEWLRDRRNGRPMSAAARVPYTIALVAKPSTVQVYFPAQFTYDWNTNQEESYSMLAVVLYSRSHYTTRFVRDGTWYVYDSMLNGGRAERAKVQVGVDLVDMPLVELAWYARDAPPPRQADATAVPRFVRKLDTPPAVAEQRRTVIELD